MAGCSGFASSVYALLAVILLKGNCILIYRGLSRIFPFTDIKESGD